jgi:alkylation response protein AidB-like acyl-CoA dehydrogenase
VGSVTVDTVRAELRAWLAEAWDPDRGLVEWREQLVEARWAVPSWPTRWYGRGLPAWVDAVVADELRRAGAVGLPVGVGTGLAAPTLLAHAAEDLCERLLRPTLTGAATWCQLFSEPGAGSDLAGLGATAVRDGDVWRVSGQKVWTTSAHHADWGLLLARTDWEAPKHRGLTFFVLPVRQPGVHVRPLRQMNGHASFNEVFLDEAVVPADHVVGEVGEGWSVAQTTLMHERGFATMRRERLDPTGAEVGRTRREAQAEADEHFAVYSWYPQRAGRADLVVPRARAHGRADDPVVRQHLAGVQVLERVGRWTAQRAAAARAAGRPPGPEGSIGKLAASELARRCAAVHAEVAGAAAMLTGPDAPEGGVVAEVLVSVPAQSIAGGTDEVQHTILGERVLGLPREPAVDRDVPFRDVPRTPGRSGGPGAGPGRAQA